MQGKAHISTNNGAQTEYVTDGLNGIMVEPDNYFSLAVAMKNLIEDKNARNRIGARAKVDFDDHLNYDVFYRQVTGLYKSLFKNSSK